MEACLYIGSVLLDIDWLMKRGISSSAEGRLGRLLGDIRIVAPEGVSTTDLEDINITNG